MHQTFLTMPFSSITQLQQRLADLRAWIVPPFAEAAKEEDIKQIETQIEQLCLDA